MKKSHKLIEKVFKSIQDGLLIINVLNYKVINSNISALNLLKYSLSEILNVNINKICGEKYKNKEFTDVISDAIEERGHYHIEMKLRCKDRSTFPAEIRVTPIKDSSETFVISWVMVIRDITDRLKAEDALRKSEKQLRHAQKMEAIGTMASHIAHDFKNIINPIISYTQLILMNLQSGKSIKREYIDEINTAANRSKELINQILSFSKQKESGKRKIDFTHVVKETYKLVSAIIPKNISFKYNKGDKDFFVMADATQLHQVVMNLCTNAIHAMEKKRGGKLLITLNEHFGPVKGWAFEGDIKNHKKPYVELAIIDNGPGIDPKFLDKIFEPFFTTKSKIKGTGLGLAIIHNIVKSYKGFISIETKLKKGTTFYIYLPKLSD